MDHIMSASHWDSESQELSNDAISLNDMLAMVESGPHARILVTSALRGAPDIASGLNQLQSLCFAVMLDTLLSANALDQAIADGAALVWGEAEMARMKLCVPIVS